MSHSENLVKLSPGRDRLSDFLPVLQKGFMQEIKTGCTLAGLFIDQFGLDEDYVKNRISTIFLNGKPVDDIFSAIVYDNDVIAISAAMPGLVGAVFRTGSALASFRSGISHFNNNKEKSRARKGLITIKLFNLLAKELGPFFLERGIILDKDKLDESISFQAHEIQAQSI